MLCVDKFTFFCVWGNLSAKRARIGENLQNLQTNLLSSTPVDKPVMFYVNKRSGSAA